MKLKNIVVAFVFHSWSSLWSASFRIWIPASFAMSQAQRKAPPRQPKQELKRVAKLILSEESAMKMDEKEIERRIRERAFKIWIDEGQPEGRDKEHWDLAKFAIAHEDGLAATLLPPESPKPEPIEAVINQGEFPTLVDQGEEVPPGGRR
jgi:Protein of unknown function (DUF2934)